MNYKVGDRVRFHLIEAIADLGSAPEQGEGEIVMIAPEQGIFGKLPYCIRPDGGDVLDEFFAHEREILAVAA